MEHQYDERSDEKTRARDTRRQQKVQAPDEKSDEAHQIGSCLAIQNERQEFATGGEKEPHEREEKMVADKIWQGRRVRPPEMPMQSPKPMAKKEHPTPTAQAEDGPNNNAECKMPKREAEPDGTHNSKQVKAPKELLFDQGQMWQGGVCKASRDAQGEQDRPRQ